MAGEGSSGARVPQGLLVWDLPDISEDHLTYFFENKRKSGGGAVESLELDKKRQEAVIFFEEPGVEEKVLDKYQEDGSFVLDGKHIKVALYSKNPTCARKEAEEEAEEAPCRTVKVKNFPADTSDETFKLYLENPRKGGGFIEDLQIDRYEGCLLVTFHDPAVAAGFVERKHTLGGQILDVKLYTPPPPPKPAPVEMYADRLLLSGVGEGTSQDCLTFFLGANTGIMPREFIKGKKPGVFLVMFDEEPDIAQLQQVCKTVQVEGAWLQVEGVPVSRTVLVTSLNPTTSKDAVELYFEVARRSGGGEVDSVTMVPGENSCFVTFMDPQIAIRVSEKQDHKLDGADLQVSLYHGCLGRSLASQALNVSQQQDSGKSETASVYKDRLVIAGVGENTTPDCLTYFLQATTDCKLKEITHGKEPGSYLVVFEKLPDMQKLEKVCQTHRLEGAQLNVSQVPVSRTVRVKNMSKSTTQDSLELYFESSRSCGGEVEAAELSSDGGTGLVTFVDPEVALRVCAKKDHKLDGARLEVCLHHECLGPGCGSSPDDFKLPAPVELRNLDKYKLMYLRETTDLLQALEKELQETYVQVGWPEKTGTTVRLECTLTPEVQGARRMLYSWGKNAQSIFQRYMEDLIKMKKKEVRRSMWEMVENRLTSINSPDREVVTLFVEKANASLIMAGMGEPVKAIYAEVEKLIQAIEKQLEEEKTVIEETIDKLKPHQLQLLRAIQFPNMVMSKYPGLQVQCTDRGIYFKGQHKLVKSAQVEMYEKVSNAANRKLTHFSPSQLAMLRNREMKLYLVEKFRADQVVAVWDVQDKNLRIHACTDKEAVTAADIVKQSLVEFKHELEQEAQAVLKSPEWRDLMKQLHASCPGVLKVVEAADCSYVQITSNDQVCHDSKDTIVNFLRDNAIYTRKIAFPRGRQKFLQTHRKRDLVNIEDVNKAFEVKIIWTEMSTEFTVRGTKDGVQRAMERLKSLAASVCYMEVTLKRPGVQRLIQSAKGMNLLDHVEKICSCIISLEKEQEMNQKKDKSRGTHRNLGAQRGFLEWLEGTRDGQGEASGYTHVRKFGPSVPDASELTFYVHAGDRQAIKNARARLEDACDKEIMHKKVAGDELKLLEPTEVDHIVAVGVSNGVLVYRYDRSRGEVYLEGLPEDVMRTNDAIQKILRNRVRVRAEPGKRKKAEILNDLVQWKFVEVTRYGENRMDYDTATNALIEKAYRDQQPKVKFSAWVDSLFVEYEIDFRKMEEYPVKNRKDTVDVVRTNKIKGSKFEQPANWKDMTDDEDFVVVQLPPSSPEYQTVVNSFRTGHQVIKVERIQNKTLYMQYSAKRQQMEAKQQGNQVEHVLWHGTASNAIFGINTYGFNRSYCGKNATAFGQGVYFAVDPRYSASNTYSVPDPSGQKHIYQARVLTGYVGPGNSSLRVPPARQGQELFDSVADNPGRPYMYIIFSDTQAYPEYLITFR